MKYSELHIGQSIFFNATINEIQVHAIGRIYCFADDDDATFYLEPWEFTIDGVVRPELCSIYQVCLYDERFEIVDCRTGELIVPDDSPIANDSTNYVDEELSEKFATLDLDLDDIEWESGDVTDRIGLEVVNSMPDESECDEPERVYVFGVGDFGLLSNVASAINAIGFDANAVIVDGDESDAVSDGKVVATNLDDVWIVHGRGCAFVKQTSTQGIMPVYRELDKWLKSHEFDNYGKMDILNVVTGEVVAYGHRCGDMWVWRH